MSKSAIHPAHCHCPRCSAPHPALPVPLSPGALALRFVLLALMAGLGRIVFDLLSSWSA